MAWCTLTACDANSYAPDGPLVRDSAGITIVDNASLAVQPDRGTWYFSSSPLVQVGTDTHPVEQAPLDPVAVWLTSTGEMVVADGNQSGWDAVMVYSATGQFLRKMGGNGEGPGEFGQLYLAWPYRGDSIAAFDTRRRITIFALDGSLGREFRLPSLDPPFGERRRGVPEMGAFPVGVFGNGMVLHASRGRLALGDPGVTWYRNTLLRVAPDGAGYDSIGPGMAFAYWWDGEAAHRAEYEPAGHYAADDSTFWFTTGESFEVREYGLAGQPIRFIRRAYERPSVTEQDRERARRAWYDLLRIDPASDAPRAKRTRDAVRDWHYGTRKPATSGVLLGDNGDIWVEEYALKSDRRPAPGATPGRWTVFDATGRWVATVETPARFGLHAVRGDRAVGVHYDEMDVATIQVYALEAT